MEAILVASERVANERSRIELPVHTIGIKWGLSILWGLELTIFVYFGTILCKGLIWQKRE